MDISREEQRVPHLSAQGGWIDVKHGDGAKIIEANCFTREGWRYSDVRLDLLRKLKRRGPLPRARANPAASSGED